MIEAVVFDMDGVLFDTERLYRQFWIKAGEEVGIPYEKMLVVCDKIAGGTKKHSEEVFTQEFGKDFDSGAFRTNAINKMDNYLDENGVVIKKGAIELLNFLNENNIKTGLATSTIRERAVKNLEYGELTKYFDKLVYGDMVNKSKPNPDIYLKACELLNVNPINTIGIEDSINGVFSCVSAGMISVMVPDMIEPTKEVRKKCDYILDSLLDVIELIKKSK